MTDDDRPLPAERTDQPGHVGDERSDVVGAGDVGVAVPAQVGRDGAVASPTERRQLMAPRPRELGKPVQEEHQWTVGGPGRERMEADPVRLERQLLDPWPVRTHVGESSHNRLKGHLVARTSRL